MTPGPGEDVSVAVGDFARLDVSRRARTVVPEIVFGQGKTADQTVRLLAAMRDADPGAPALATRCPPETLDAVRAHFVGGPVAVDDVARTALVGSVPVPVGAVLVLTAGTVDLPAAREALVTLAALGVSADLLTDVGVAGLHRLLGQLETIRGAEVLVVAAGMDGALPSVVAGLVETPVVGLPTSAGYGVASGGATAAMSMLASCSPGLVVVNVDNGVGAAAHAAKIVHLAHRG